MRNIIMLFFYKQPSVSCGPPRMACFHPYLTVTKTPNHNSQRHDITNSNEPEIIKPSSSQLFETYESPNHPKNTQENRKNVSTIQFPGNTSPRNPAPPTQLSDRTEDPPHFAAAAAPGTNCQGALATKAGRAKIHVFYDVLCNKIHAKNPSSS